MLFSGIAFVLAISGLLLVPTTIMRSLAPGAILVGIVSVVAALTLLPAVLRLLGDRVNLRASPASAAGSTRTTAREPVLGRDRAPRDARPVLCLVVGVAGCSRCAIPVLGLKIGAAGITTLPDELAVQQGFVALARRSRRRAPTRRGRRSTAPIAPADASRVVRLERALAEDRASAPSSCR